MYKYPLYIIVEASITSVIYNVIKFNQIVKLRRIVMKLVKNITP